MQRVTKWLRAETIPNHTATDLRLLQGEAVFDAIGEAYTSAVRVMGHLSDTQATTLTLRFVHLPVPPDSAPVLDLYLVVSSQSRYR